MHRLRVPALLCALLALLPGTAQAASAPQQLLAQDFPDPSVVPAAGGYLAFATTSPAGTVPMAAASTAPGPWKVIRNALANPPAWAVPDTQIWAPDVSRRADGTWLMYFSATSAERKVMCVGAAVADDVRGPYRPTGDRPLVCPPQDGSDIDPQGFTDADGTRYLLYKSLHGNGPPSTLWLQQVDPTGLVPTGGRKPLLRVDSPAEKGVIEAPFLVKTGGGYTLLYSAGTYTDESYHTAYATASTITGPYRKAGTLLTTSGLGGAVDGPGGAAVADGRVYFHGWLPGRTARALYSLPIRFEGTKPVLG
ncbi:glycoside hydrolase [Amycolatopsis sp. NBRC 101858]|uniref:glycoside hydrolase family 43 protein n=1 Tax=Amycolatopsis sp. NBRC 101858 TaxID=3032200 RepID=UPI0024A3E682|nr:glycoside hydrolase family 43 protein [Amycolatopsis sp. NBRC 101858]GLY39015.1 glycoside hydrolase [Amycolatopsis sp. NBRC 101858]